MYGFSHPTNCGSLSTHSTAPINPVYVKLSAFCLNQYLRLVNRCGVVFCCLLVILPRRGYVILALSFDCLFCLPVCDRITYERVYVCRPNVEGIGKGWA